MRGHFDTQRLCVSVACEQIVRKEKSALTHFSNLNEGKCIYDENEVLGCFMQAWCPVSTKGGGWDVVMCLTKFFTKLLAPSTPAFYFSFCALIVTRNL